MGPSHQAEEIANPLLAPPLENAMAGRNVVAERYDSDLVPGGTPFLSRAIGVCCLPLTCFGSWVLVNPKEELVSMGSPHTVGV